MGATITYGLPKKVLLRLRRDYQQMRREGRTWADRNLVLSVRPNGLSYSRFGFVVSRRVGNAVCRNRVRRLLKETTRLERPGVEPGWDMVWIARVGARTADFHRVQRSVRGLLGRAGLWSGGKQWRSEASEEVQVAPETEKQA